MPKPKKKLGLAGIATGYGTGESVDASGGKAEPTSRIPHGYDNPGDPLNLGRDASREFDRGITRAFDIKKRTGKYPDINKPVQMATVKPGQPHSGLAGLGAMARARPLKKRYARL